MLVSNGNCENSLLLRITLRLNNIVFSSFTAGLPNEVRSVDGKSLRSKHGFQGCLANVHLNGESPDLIRDALLPSTLISSGCEGKVLCIGYSKEKLATESNTTPHTMVIRQATT